MKETNTTPQQMDPDFEQFKERLSEDKPFYQTIDPTLAAAILKLLNARNRTIKSHALKKWKAAMIAGEWSVRTNDPIRFYGDNNLADGQHRLLALIEADKPVEFLIAPNTAEDYRYCGDRGMHRSNTEAFQMEGLANPKVLSAMAPLCYKWSYAGNPTKGPNPSPKVLAGFVKDNADTLQASVEFALNIEQAPVTVKPAHIAATHWKYSRDGGIDLDSVEKYLSETATGTAHADDHNIVATKVRSAFEKSCRKITPRLSPAKQLALLCEGLKLTLAEKTTTKFKSTTKILSSVFDLVDA